MKYKVSPSSLSKLKKNFAKYFSKTAMEKNKLSDKEN